MTTIRGEISIGELEICLNLNQYLIDSAISEARMNGNVDNVQTAGKLNKLNVQKQEIIRLIEEYLDERFS